jgi:GNAT superfamily N-acetyltransferase
MPSEISPELAFHPLTLDRWDDFVELFGKHGAYGGCWCMWWRLTRREFSQQQGEGNRRAMQEIVSSGEVPGILAYRGERAVGWCGVAPRESYASLERSPVLKRLDDLPVWSIVCFFIARDARGQGVGERLVRGALDYARSRGAQIVEAYPILPRSTEVPPVSSFMGLPSMYERAGFIECARPSKNRVVMRHTFE